MYLEKNLYRLGISVFFILTVASFLSIFEFEDKPKRKKKKNRRTEIEEDKMSSSSAALLVSSIPVLSIGKPDSTKIPYRNEDELMDDDDNQETRTEPEYLSNENINEKYYRMKFSGSNNEISETIPQEDNQDIHKEDKKKSNL